MKILLKTERKDDYLWEGFINFFLISESSEDHEPDKSGEWVQIMEDPEGDFARYLTDEIIEVKSFDGRNLFRFRKDGLVIFEGEELNKPMDHFVVREDHIHFYDCYDETENWPYEVL